MLNLLAQTTGGTFSHEFWSILGSIFVYIFIVGGVLALLSFKMTDLVTPGNLRDEIIVKKNGALAIVTSAALFSDAWIIKSVIAASSTTSDIGIVYFVNDDAWNLVLNTLMYGAIAIIFKWIAFIVIDKAWKSIDFQKELKENNVPFAGLVAGFFVCLGFIVGAVVGG